MDEKIVKRWNEKIEYIQQFPSSLSEWEEEFVDSIGKKLSEGVELSWKQSKVLSRIFEKLQKNWE